MSAAALATILGSLASVAGGVWNNMQNAKNQMEINKNNIGMQLAYNADQVAVARMNNQTQIDLANTAHQREVNDLRDAGLNPILSATGGNGAAMPSLGTPAGNAARAETSTSENPLREFGTSAREIGRLMSLQYRAETEAALLQNEHIKSQIRNQELINEDQALENSVTRRRTQLENLRLGNEYDVWSERADDVLDLLNKRVVKASTDGYRSEDGYFQLDRQTRKDIADAIFSDLSLRGDQRVLQWISALMGAGAQGSSSAVNGARFLQILKAIK